MNRKHESQPADSESIENLIQTIRGRRVIFDADLARIYGVATKRLNEAVRRNPQRFAADFAFVIDREELARSRSQFATLKRGQNAKYVPRVFTEHGAIMAANVLSSPRAVHMSVFVVRAFVKMREALAQDKELAAKLAELELKLTARLDKHETAIVAILEEIKKLMEPSLEPGPQRREIGFHVRDAANRAPLTTTRQR